MSNPYDRYELFHELVNIVVHSDNTRFAPYAERYYAYDDDTYDGPGCALGKGATHAEAIEGLILEMFDRGDITHNERLDMLRIYSVRQRA